MIFRKFESHLKMKSAKIFSSISWKAFLIIVPAIVIVNVYLFSIFFEYAIKKRRSPTIGYEVRFASIREDLPANEYVNYISDQKEDEDYDLVRYALIPARLVKGLKPEADYLVVQYLESAKIPTIEGYTLQRDYGNGVMLYRRSFD